MFFIHLSVDGHLACFHVLTVVKNAAVNIGVNISFQIRVFIFSRFMPRSGIEGSYGNSIFSFLRNLILFSMVAATICIPTRVPFSLYPFQHLSFVVGSCFVIQSAILCLLISMLSLLTFKVIMCLLPLQSLLFSWFCSSLFLSSCFSFYGLMDFFCVMFEFLSSRVLWIRNILLLWGYPGFQVS